MIDFIPTRKIYLFALIVCLSAEVHAAPKESFNPPVAPLAQLNWQKIDQAQYEKNLFQCQLKIQEYKWSKTTWPEQNPEPKPSFAEIADYQDIKLQVDQVLQKQTMLKYAFQQSIDVDLLQRDLQRMVQNSKDKIGLQALFHLLNNDPVSIALCVSLPNLTQNLSHLHYQRDPEIHKAQRQKAEQAKLAIDQNQFKASIKSQQANEISIHEIRYQQQMDAETVQNKRAVSLNEEEFFKKRAALDNPQIQENDHAFFYSKLEDSGSDWLLVKQYYWYKQDIDDWLSGKSFLNSIAIPDLQMLYLPKIDVHTADKSAIPENSWIYAFEPDPSDGNESMIWTGSSMIVWGGSQGSYRNTGAIYFPETDHWQKTSQTGAPPPLVNHTAVWSGSEMLVWGKDHLSQPTAIAFGGAYNPETNRWRSLQTKGQPEARTYHYAIWSGSEMVIWGGRSDQLENTGAKYNVQNDEWTTMSTVNAPEGRINATFIVTNNKVIVWGGRAQSAYLASGSVYDLSTDTWSPISQMNAPEGRGSFGAVSTGTEIILWGGRISDAGDATNTGAIYNPVQNQWSEINNSGAPSDRYAHSAIWTGEEMIVWGGTDIDSYLSTGGRYNPTTNSWATVTEQNAPSEYGHHKSVWTGTEMIVWGGRGRVGARYTPIQDTWREMGNAFSPSPRYHHSTVWTGAEMIVWGGEDQTSKLNSGGRYDPVTDSWQLTSTQNVSARSHHTAVWTGAEMMIWGDYSFFSTGYLYRPSSNSWVEINASGGPNSHQYHSASWTGTEMLIWGGLDSNQNELNTGAKYNPFQQNWTPISTTNAPYARFRHTSVWTGEELWVWGDSFGDSDLYHYDPSLDSWSQTSLPYSGLADAQSIWSNTYGMMVWGGTDDVSVYSSGFIVTPFLQVFPTTNPDSNPFVAPRSDHSMVLVNENKAIIWGGGTSPDYTQSGGVYGIPGGNWQNTSEYQAPEGRRHHSAVWTGRVMLIWGGLNFNQEPINSFGTYAPNPLYSVGGNVVGLHRGNKVTLRMNDHHDLMVNDNGVFTFDYPLPQGADYDVIIIQQPNDPVQTCTIILGQSGTIGASNEEDIVVHCEQSPDIIFQSNFE